MSEDTYPGNMYQSQTLNRYSYVMNNPINYWDPTGNVAEGLYPDAFEFRFVLHELKLKNF